MLKFGLFCFFFSSRRRHTRYWRDWCSDVCSSDLHQRGIDPGEGGSEAGRGGDQGARLVGEHAEVVVDRVLTGTGADRLPQLSGDQPLEGLRSEEHTSELQSRQYLVCRLLLDKNNQLHAGARENE